jgi:DNA-binding transcriptional LysR family regulator
MDVRQLEVFLEVAHRQSFTQAARALGVAQPAVSQIVARLEDELGLALFDRTSRRVRLTEAGTRLLAHAERIRADLAVARREMAALRETAPGRLIVGATPTVATHLLPRALAAFRAECPAIEVVLREGGTGTVANMVERGAVDVAIIVLPVEHADLVTSPLLTEPLLLAVAEHSPITQADGPVSLRVAADEPFILYRASYHLRSATIDGCRAAGFEPHVALEGGEMETVLRMVAAGLGVSLVPQLAFEGAPRPGVVALPVRDPPLERTLALAWRSDRPPGAVAVAFIATLRAIALG